MENLEYNIRAKALKTVVTRERRGIRLRHFQSSRRRLIFGHG
jgi:hypothetical protein